MKKSISKKQLREFGFLIGFGFPIIIGWLIPVISGHLFRTWSLWIGFPALILGILKPSLLSFPYRGWMAIGLALGWLNSRLILGLIYLVILLPISFIMRILGDDPLNKKQSNVISYREIKKDANFDFKRIF